MLRGAGPPAEGGGGERAWGGLGARGKYSTPATRGPRAFPHIMGMWVVAILGGWCYNFGIMVEQERRLLTAEADSNQVMLRRAGVLDFRTKKRRPRWPFVVLMMASLVFMVGAGVFIYVFLNRPTDVDRQNAENNLISIGNASGDMERLVGLYDFHTSSGGDMEELLMQMGEFYAVVRRSEESLMNNRLLGNLPPENIWREFLDYMKGVEELNETFSEAMALMLPVVAPTVELVRGRDLDRALDELERIRGELGELELKSAENEELREDVLGVYDELMEAVEDYGEAMELWSAGRGSFPLLDEINRVIFELSDVVGEWQEGLRLSGNFGEIRIKLVFYWSSL